ncbi:hypothetical protein L218DRAFT_967371 [Marasmius fiardii PR-910]|nr:hypothetical protein L218DRAFT_967371 [Marasmius fiardii PR-910]
MAQTPYSYRRYGETPTYPPRDGAVDPPRTASPYRGYGETPNYPRSGAAVDPPRTAYPYHGYGGTPDYPRSGAAVDPPVTAHPYHDYGETPNYPRSGTAVDPSVTTSSYYSYGETPVTASPYYGYSETPPNAKRPPGIRAGYNYAGGDDEDGENEDDDDKERPRLNLLEDVKRGIIKTTDGKEVFTILLLGETGVGKTALLSFIGNVLEGHGVDQYIDMHGMSNEKGGSQSQSQTDAATLYEFKSQNGVVVRILDTPGLGDTRGLTADELHKATIAEAIQDHVDVVNAVLILTNGTVPRLTVATDYALTTLTSIFPRTLVHNIGFIYTNVSNPLSWNFATHTLPYELQNAKQFLFDNPLAMWRKYKSIEGKLSPQMRRQHSLTVQDAERKALEVLVDLADWIDQCPPQPTKDIISLYEQSQAIEKNIVDAFAQLQYAAEKKRELEELKKQLENSNFDVGMFENLEITSRQRYIQRPQDDRLTVVCLVPGCYSNCREHRSNPYNRWREHESFDRLNEAGVCSACGHELTNHQTSPWQWHQVEEDVDPGEQMMYGRAKGKGRQEASKELAEVEIEKATKEIDKATKEIREVINGVARAAEAYSELSLSGSFITQIDKSIQKIKHNIEEMSQKGDAVEAQKLKESMGNMEKKLEFLAWATKAKQEKSNFISRVGW